MANPCPDTLKYLKVQTSEDKDSFPSQEHDQRCKGPTS